MMPFHQHEDPESVTQYPPSRYNFTRRVRSDWPAFVLCGLAALTFIAFAYVMFDGQW